MTVLLRSRQPLSSLTAATTAAARAFNPAVLVRYHTLAGDIRQSSLRERLMATLSGFFGVLAVLLAMVGLYGVMSYMVALRRNEFGIRAALGADRADIRRMVMRDATVLLVVGLAAGVPLSLGSAQAAGALLFGITPTDPSTLVLAGAGLVIVATAASYLPASRASRLSPPQALREG